MGYRSWVKGLSKKKKKKKTKLIDKGNITIGKCECGEVGEDKGDINGDRRFDLQW